MAQAKRRGPEREARAKQEMGLSEAGGKKVLDVSYLGKFWGTWIVLLWSKRPFHTFILLIKNQISSTGQLCFLTLGI